MRRLMGVAEPAALAQLALLGFAFLALTHAYVTSDFSVETVWANSHSAQAADLQDLRRVGEPRGLDAAVGADPRRLRRRRRAVRRATCRPRCAPTCSRCRLGIAVAFLLFIVFASNPFLRIPPQPVDGSGLNPILQDPALAFHPPFLYAGYVGLSMAFSFAIAALIEGRTDAAWARWVRPWTLAAWMCLTLGIAMGSWWAYYELGWGGWWFWDPVENASFMPWLAATALLHSALVMEKREALKVWTILLAILAFSLSLMGTFLVRSGVLTSVHAFAVDPRRGVVHPHDPDRADRRCACALCLARAATSSRAACSRPSAARARLVLNNVLLTTACATVLVGTLYPLAARSRSPAPRSRSARPTSTLTFVPLMVPLLLAMPFGPFSPGSAATCTARCSALSRGGAASRSSAHRAHIRRLLARAVAGAVRHRARRLDRGRRCLRMGLPRQDVRAGPFEEAGAAPAACPARPMAPHSRIPASASWSSASLPPGLAERAHRHHEAGRQRRDRRLRADLPRRRAGPGPNYQRAGRPLRASRAAAAGHGR